jgi:putative membrane protein
MGFGFVVARFGLFLREMVAVNNTLIKTNPTLAGLNTLTGTILILLGVLVLIVSIYAHWGMVGRAERGDYLPPARWSLAVVLSMVLAAVGMAMAVYLATVEA